ncbi:hypothetical protein RDI58_028951 [Solanum bulbocastanum]|uniref:DUF4283 domain-containing protein n=1 Tax=Solanum bulbocastanum TaxID=147425 RepID=A0AAN8Y1N0_SOLBU
MKKDVNLAPLPTEPLPEHPDKSPSYKDMLIDQLMLPNSAADLDMPSFNAHDATASVSKETSKESQDKILLNGRWFINGHFPSVQIWVPNFMPNTKTHNSSVVWVRLPQLPTEFYDAVILEKNGNTIGTLLKVDACTSAMLRGRYARLFVEIDLHQPVKSQVVIGVEQIIEYEISNLLCTQCGRIGLQHQHICSSIQRPNVVQSDTVNAPGTG